MTLRILAMHEAKDQPADQCFTLGDTLEKMKNLTKRQRLKPLGIIPSKLIGAQRKLLKMLSTEKYTYRLSLNLIYR